MEVIVLQHIKIEDPGYIKDLMLKDGINLTTIELDEGEKIPENLSKFDAMFCMGEPMDTWMEDKYPWLIDEKKKIKNFVVDLKKPYLGFCLGCQLLGEIVGGKVVKSTKPEIGMLDIRFLRQKESDLLFSTFPDRIKALQWHSYEVVKDTTVNEWGCVIEYKTALEEKLGEGALEKFDKEAKSNMFEMNNCSKILYSNFKKIIK